MVRNTIVIASTTTKIIDKQQKYYNKSMNVMFLDESGDHSLDKIDSSYPMFVLAGCIFDFDYYTSFVEAEAKKLKLKYFRKENIIFRSYDIRKQKGDFSILVDKKIRESFYSDLDKFISSLNFTIIAGAINKSKLKTRYPHPNNPYYLCLQFILERSVMFLGRSGEKMMFRIESRETHNDQKLSIVFDSFKNTKHKLFTKDEIQAKILDLSFNQKIQNIIGMQVADLVAYPIGKWVLDDSKENIAFKIVQAKFHRKPSDKNFLNYGLKIFP